MGMNIGFGERQ